jgi:hypothetical protein
MIIESQHPKDVFGNAKWIWPESQGYDLVNYFAQARRAFRLAAVPKVCRIRVTADSRYQLFVNGRYVCRGPARGYQYSWPYDEIDLAPYLKEGPNALAILAHNYGLGTFQYVSADAGGIILAGRAGRVDLSTGPEWKVRRAPGFARSMSRASKELGFVESFDARLDDRSWILSSYDDSKWPAPYMAAAGSMPWHNVEPRGIPLLDEKLIAPRTITAECSGRSRIGWREAANFTANYLAEKHAWRKPAVSMRVSKGASTFVVPAAGSGRLRAFVLDFGREVIGAIGLETSGAAGGETIDAQVAETCTGLRPDVVDPSLDCKVALCNRLTLAKGATRHEQFAPWGFRYLVIVVRDTRKPLTLKVHLRQAWYPLDVKAEFHSSDAKLNDIYRISVLAQRACMLDAYVDCPWREQAQWWGDARVQAANTFRLSADARLLARGIRQTAGQETPNGLTYGLTPTSSHHCVLPDYTLTWIMTIWDYYRQTGDTYLIRQHAPRMLRALSYFENALSPNGLLPYDARYWLFLDWADVFKNGYPTLYNVMYFWALETAAKLFRLAGSRVESARFARAAKASKRAIMSRLFDAKNARFFGGLDWKGRPVRHDTAHAYALAVVSGLCPEYDRAFVSERLVPLVKGPCPTFEVTTVADGKYPPEPSPFFMYYVFEALKSHGRGAEAIDCIRRWWGVFVEKGFTTTPEMWGVPAGRWSACHAWSAHPIVHLDDVLLGVTQTTVGWRRIKFEPIFEKVRSVSGKVATPLGVVESRWARKDGSVEVTLVLPERMTADVRLPGLRTTVTGGRHAWTVRVPS